MTALVRVIGRISAVLGGIAMAQAIVLTAVMVYEVVCRFGFNAPNIWSYDLAYMLSGTMLFLGAGYTLREEGHVRIDFLSQRLPPRLARLVEGAFLVALLLPCLAVMTWAVAAKAWAALVSGQTNYTSPWAPVMWPFYGAIAVGMAALWLQALARAVTCLSGGGDAGRRAAP